MMMNQQQQQQQQQPPTTATTATINNLNVDDDKQDLVVVPTPFFGENMKRMVCSTNSKNGTSTTRSTSKEQLLVDSRNTRSTKASIASGEGREDSCSSDEEESITPATDRYTMNDSFPTMESCHLLSFIVDRPNHCPDGDASDCKKSKNGDGGEDDELQDFHVPLNDSLPTGYSADSRMLSSAGAECCTATANTGRKTEAERPTFQEKLKKWNAKERELMLSDFHGRKTTTRERRSRQNSKIKNMKCTGNEEESNDGWQQ